MRYSLTVFFTVCCLLFGVQTRELFSRSHRQQGEFYLNHINTLKALGLTNDEITDYSRCGGLIGCGLVNISTSGKRKRSRPRVEKDIQKNHYYDFWNKLMVKDSLETDSDSTKKDRHFFTQDATNPNFDNLYGTLREIRKRK